LYFHNVAGTLTDICIDENQMNKSFILLFFQMEVGVSGLNLEAAATNVREELLLVS
jgi:hypothetical protein